MSLGRNLIASMGGQNRVVKRVSGGHYNTSGIWIADGPSTASVFASVQPFTGRELVRLPEGERTRERRKLYSADLLQAHNESSGIKADVVVLDGADFQIESVEAWPDYWKAIAVRVERAEA